MSDSEDPSSMETAPRSPRIETELVFPGVGDPSASSVSGSVGGIKLQSSSSPEDWGQHQGSRFGLDIGGTLTKLIFFDSTKRPSWCDGWTTNNYQSLNNTFSSSIQILNVSSTHLKFIHVLFFVNKFSTFCYS